jgi:VWFA-related protein
MRFDKTGLAILGLTVSMVGLGTWEIGWSQTAAPLESSAPTLHVTSRETVVDVTARDAKGNAVRGLKQSDFSVEEDGKPQPIRSFTETGQDTAAGALPKPLPKLPPNVYSNLQPAPVTGVVNIILLDDLNVGPTAQSYSRQEAAKYLRTMPPGTQVALLRLGNGLTILQGFSSDPDVLIAAMNDKKNSIIPAGPPGADRNMLTLEGLREVAAFAAGIKGRKNLIWFTVGMKEVTDPQFRSKSQPDYTPDLHRTYEMLTSARVAVYSVDPRGLANFAAQSAVSGGGPINAQTGAAAAGAQTVAFAYNAGDHLSMESVAEATGGGAYYDTNGVKEAVAKAVESGANYYTLSYVPPGVKYDGKHHTIHVKVDRPGVRLVYRDEYYAEDPTHIAHAAVPVLAATTPPPQTNTMTASMARFAPPATQLLFDVRVAPTTTAPKPTDPHVMGAIDPKLKDKPLARYDFLYLLPAEQITFTDGTDGAHSGSVEFDIVASDVFGKVITSMSQTMTLPLTNDEYQQFLKTPFQFLQQLDLPPGEMFVKIGIVDGVSGKVGTLEIPLTVAKK